MKVSTLVKMIKDPMLFLRQLTSSGILNWIPDDVYLRIKWRLSMGGSLDLDSPKTFNEKIQWLKLNDRKEEYCIYVDKYEAKKWAQSIIGEEHIIPTFVVCDRFDEINFELLPNQFVMKCTHDSGGLVICRNKPNFDVLAAKKRIESCLSKNFFYVGREWPYKNVRPKIIIEKFMTDNRTDSEGLTDFKFFCFNGVPKFLYISQGLDNHNTAMISFYDLDGRKLSFKRSDYKEIPGDCFLLPSCFDEMVNTAKKLATAVGCAFVRVDLYEISGNYYFSEITFSPCSGYLPFEPKTVDEDLGKMILIK